MSWLGFMAISAVFAYLLVGCVIAVQDWRDGHASKQGYDHPSFLIGDVFMFLSTLLAWPFLNRTKK